MEDKYFESTIIALEANHKEFTAVNLAGHDLKGGMATRNENSLLVHFLPFIEFLTFNCLFSIKTDP